MSSLESEVTFPFSLSRGGVVFSVSQQGLLDQCAINRGMLAEVAIRLSLTRIRLRQHPNLVEEVDREIGFLENEVETILLTSEFLQGILDAQPA